MSTPTSQQYFKTLFPHLNLDWKLIYLLPRILTKNTSLRAFQYNVLSNVLYLNHKLFQIRASTNSLCLYCNQHDETVQHLFSICNQVISLYTEIKLYYVCPQIGILGYANTDDICFLTQNLILLILLILLTLLILLSHTFTYQGVRNVSFSENYVYVLNEWSFIVLYVLSLFRKILLNETIDSTVNVILENKRGSWF